MVLDGGRRAVGLSEWMEKEKEGETRKWVQVMHLLAEDVAVDPGGHPLISTVAKLL